MVSPSNTLACWLQQIRTARSGAGFGNRAQSRPKFLNNSINSKQLSGFTRDEFETSISRHAVLAQQPSKSVKGANSNACATLTQE
jgi:hypothetical protein